jgi:hypothetical protein
MNVGIFIVTFARDIAYLGLCLASIKKFSKGFSQVMVAVPTEDLPLIRDIREQGANIQWFVDVPGKGHLKHQVEKCRADYYMAKTEFICHVDADCIFKEPVTPEDYFVNGKPVLCIAGWDKVQDATCWKAPTERALGFHCDYETMRRHPAVHYRSLYGELRQRIQSVHGVKFDEYILAQPSAPMGFSEFNALGSLAIKEPWRDKYHIIDVGKDPWPPQKLVQFWSRSPVNAKQDVWIDGVKRSIVPEQYTKEVLQ